jgi:hypothetical protein
MYREFLTASLNKPQINKAVAHSDMKQTISIVVKRLLDPWTPSS